MCEDVIEVHICLYAHELHFTFEFMIIVIRAHMQQDGAIAIDPHVKCIVNMQC